MTFEAEVRLLRWSDSSTAGRTATFEFPADGDVAHPFRGLPVGPKNGQRFKISFELIGDDELPIPDPATVAGSPPPRAAPAPQAEAQEAGAKNLAKSWAAKEVYRNKTAGEKAVVLASLLIKDAEFQRWLGILVEDGDGKETKIRAEEIADRMLKKRCEIGSKSDLADSKVAQIELNKMRIEFERATQRIAEVRG